MNLSLTLSHLNMKDIDYHFLHNMLNNFLNSLFIYSLGIVIFLCKFLNFTHLNFKFYSFIQFS